MITTSLISLAAVFAVSGSVQEQEVAAAPAAEVQAASWNVISRSSSTVYLLDVNAIKTEGGVKTAYIARVPAQGSPTDKTHTLSEVNLKCSANQVKPGDEIYIGADGSEEERIPSDYDFEPISRNSLDDYAKSIVCGGDRSSQTFESVDAFINAGRPVRQ